MVFFERTLKKNVLGRRLLILISGVSRIRELYAEAQKELHEESCGDQAHGDQEIQVLRYSPPCLHHYFWNIPFQSVISRPKRTAP